MSASLPDGGPARVPALPRDALTATAAGLDRVLGAACEAAAAVLVAAEVVILFAGVFSRYVLDNPLTWSDELASTLFLWMVMLGSAVALRRGEHMRLELGRYRLAESTRQALATFATVVTAAFAAAMLLPSWRYLVNQWVIETPALGIPASWRASSLLVGFVLILLLALSRMAMRARARHVGGSLAVVGVAAAALWAGQAPLLAMGTLNLLVFFVALTGLCVFIGVPIGFSFGMATVCYLAFASRVPLTIVVSRMDEGMSSLVLLAVPLFVVLGLLMEITGLARVLVQFLVALVGHVRGGLSYVLLGAMVLVSGISGAKAADMAAVAPVLFPEMKRRGIHEGELVALLATSAAMSETIPPSLVLIMIGSVTGVSIASLFAGGLLPALVLAVSLMALAWWRSRGEDMTGVRRVPLRGVARALLAALPALVLPFLIRSAVVDGIATATEVSTFGIAYCIVVGPLCYGRFPLRRLVPMLVETASLSGAILFIIGAATAMAWALTRSGFSQLLVRSVVAAPGGAVGFMALSILLFAVLGSVLEGIPVIVLFGPLLFPAAHALHISEVHYAMVAILAMGIGLFAPPFGVGFYAACAIARTEPDVAIPRVWPYIGALAVGVMVVAAVPWFSTAFL